MRAWLNRWRRWAVQQLLFRRVFGEQSQGRWLPHTRISPSTCIEHADRLQMADHVYIGPFNWIEASGGVVVGEGVQITSHVCIVTHSSHRAMRLLGRAYSNWPAGRPMPGWVAGPVAIGPYCFIGPHSLLEAGTVLGAGCIVRAGSVLRGRFAPHSVIAGNPAQVVGDARDGDARWLADDPVLRAHHAAWAEAAGGDSASAAAGPPGSAGSPG